MNSLKSLVLAVLLSVQANAMAGTPASSTPTTTNTNISTDLFADGSYSASKSYAGEKSFTDNYTFNLTSSLLQEFNSLSTTLNYTNSTSVGCALLIFCGSSTKGFSDLTLTITSATTSTSANTTASTSSSNNHVFITPILFWSATNSTQNTMSTDWISLLSEGKYTVSVAGTTLRDGGSYSLGVTAVPEPQTGAMVVLGLGLLGMIARRKNA